MHIRTPARHNRLALPPSSLAQQLLVVSATCPSSLEAAPSSPLLPLPRSISGSCLSMSQHCRCHNSPAGRTAGEEKTGEGLRGGGGGGSAAALINTGKGPPTGQRLTSPTDPATAFWSRRDSELFLQKPPCLVGALVCVLHLALRVNEQGTCPAASPCLQPPPEPCIDCLDLA